VSLNIFSNYKRWFSLSSYWTRLVFATIYPN